jgi:hypothetical protein
VAKPAAKTARKRGSLDIIAPLQRERKTAVPETGAQLGLQHEHKDIM